MKTADTEMGGYQKILERKEAELSQVLRKRDDIAIEKSADQKNEKAALRRIRDGSFGTCIDCESAISPKRLAAVPWAPRCIQCQDSADRDVRERADGSEPLSNAA